MTDSTSTGLQLLGQHVLAAVVFALIGLIAFAVAIWIIDRVTPFSLRKEIEEDQNTALALVISSVMIGVSIIIAAAIFG